VIDIASFLAGQTSGLLEKSLGAARASESNASVDYAAAFEFLGTEPVWFVDDSRHRLEALESQRRSPFASSMWGATLIVLHEVVQKL
jgi:hypothetical protein